MHTQSIQAHVNHAQANNGLNTTAATDVRQRSYDIEHLTIDGMILIDTIFETLDGMTDVPDHLMKGFAAISCFAKCAKRHLVLIGEASGEIVTITQAVSK